MNIQIPNIHSVNRRKTLLPGAMGAARVVLTIWIAVIAVWSSSSTAHAETLTLEQRRQIIDEAQQSYDRGIAVLRNNPAQANTEFRGAAERFQLVSDSGILNGPLLFNLGNAYLQAGDLGRAILSYRRAERLIPGDPRLQSNLRFARTQCRSQIEVSGQRELIRAVLGWHERMPLRSRFVLLLICNAGLWLVLTMLNLRPGGLTRLTGVLLAVIWVGLGVSVAADVLDWGRRPVGVLVRDDVTVRKGNGIGFEPQFDQPLHAGVEFTVLEQRGEWIQLQLSNGQEGWIERNDAELTLDA